MMNQMSKKRINLDLLDDPDALADQLGQAQDVFVQYRTPIIGAAIGLLLLIGGIVGYRVWQSGQNETAQNELFPSIYQLEADSTRKALNGDGANPGILAVIDDYGSTATGNIAKFEAGIGLMKEGKYDEAIERLKSFSAPDLLVQGRAYCLIGDAYMEKKSHDEAADYYRKAADYKPGKFITPDYLKKLAIAYESAKKPDQAIRAYAEIIDKYADSPEVGNARKYKALLEAASAE
jgi:TolA-binding protein